MHNCVIFNCMTKSTYFYTSTKLTIRLNIMYKEVPKLIKNVDTTELSMGDRFLV